MGVCLVLVFLVYGRSLWGGFVFDDRAIVENQGWLAPIKNVGLVLAAPFWDEPTGLYRPITLLSYNLNFLLGQQPWVFHLVNLLLYALSGWLLFEVVNKFFHNKVLAYLAAILFLVLPIHVEAVAYITGRSELLALFFSLLFFWELARDKTSWWRTALWLLLALGSKETAVAAWLIALGLVWFKEKKLFCREVWEKYLLTIVSCLGSLVVYFGARVIILGQQYFLSAGLNPIQNPLKQAPVLARVSTALKVLLLYLGKSFWPANLCPDYSFNQIPIATNLKNPEAILGLVVLFILLAAIFVFWKRAPILSLGALWFLSAYLVISNLFFPIGTIAAERLIYYSSVGLCLWLAGGIMFLGQIKKPPVFKWLAVILSVAIILIFCLVSWRQGGYWLTEKSVFERAMACSPNSVFARANLGVLYLNAGNVAAAKEQLLASQQILPEGTAGGNNALGMIYLEEKNYALAKEMFLKNVATRYNNLFFEHACINLAVIAIEQGNLAEARQWLKKIGLSEQGTTDFIGKYQASHSLKGAAK